MWTPLRRGQWGVALLEVIVAMTILAGAGLALMGWLRQSFETASRLQQVQTEVRLQLNAQALMAHVNPALNPEGISEVPGLTVQWKVLTAPTLQPVAGFGALEESTGQMLTDTRWYAGLYQVSVLATQNTAPSGRQPARDAAAKVEFTLELAGYTNAQGQRTTATPAGR